jgi:hypothetical protein
MISNGEDDRRWRGDPAHRLESPLLQEELLAGEPSPTEAEYSDPEVEELTAPELEKKLTRLSLLPHVIVRNGTDTALAPAEMDPGFYDGPEKYRITSGLQTRLNAVMKDHPKLAHIHVALVDLTRDLNKPEFAGYYHKRQLFVASVAKMAPMPAAYQLRKDVRVAFAKKRPSSLTELFDALRDDWAATQTIDPKVKDVPFTQSITLRSKVVLVRGSPLPLKLSKAPQLPNVFSMPSGGTASSINFRSTGESRTKLKEIKDAFKHAFEPPRGDKRTRLELAKDRSDSVAAMNALGFLERLRLALGGSVPASNHAVASIVRDVGYAYIASTLLQSGLYDPARGGGLWLGSDYWSGTWMGAPAGGVAQSATAGSLAAFMTLLVQDRLVDSQSSGEMRLLLGKTPVPTTHPTIISQFEEGLLQKVSASLIVRVLSKVGVFQGIDDCAFIERKLDATAGAKTLRYVAVGLRAHPTPKGPAEMKELIQLLDECIVANNP